CAVAPAECLMVGDTKFDVEAGRAAGMKTCGYIPGFRGRTELAEAGADFLIERFSELRMLVECARTPLRVSAANGAE
ncbi:MAG TPA: HAD hydrolase-like protein, partial [Blastocatellia bacterium]|nr:HAD hydrolase-like protein [Blastocatellia bacterium]